MACTENGGVGRTCEVYLALLLFLVLKLLLESVEVLLCGILEFVDFYADLAFLLGRNLTELCHEAVDDAFFAQVLKTQCLKLLGVCSRCALNLFEQLVNLSYHSYSLFFQK